MGQSRRQHAAEGALHDDAASGERLDAAGDVGAVRSTDACLREQLRQPGAGDTSAPAAPNAPVNTRSSSPPQSSWGRVLTPRRS